MASRPDRPKATKPCPDMKQVPANAPNKTTSKTGVKSGNTKSEQSSKKPKPATAGVVQTEKIIQGRGKASISNQDVRSRPRCLPAGFVTLEEMQARLNEKKQGKIEKTQTVPVAKRNIDAKEGDKNTKPSNPGLTEAIDTPSNLSEKPKEKEAPSEAKLVIDTQKAIKHAEQKESTARLEKSRTYRNPTLGASDSIVCNKSDISVSTRDCRVVNSEEDTAEPRRKHLVSIEKSETRRLSKTTSGPDVTDRAIHSAKTSHSYSSSLSLPVPKTETSTPNALKIMIMNASGKKKAGLKADWSKHVIHTVIAKTLPDILLFQEFKWADITGKTWRDFPIPDHYRYKRHDEASIMYDSTCINIQNFLTEIDSLLKTLQNNDKNHLKKRFPLDFTPVSRMSLSRVTSTKSSEINFMVISWHGPYNKGSGCGGMGEEARIEAFKYLMGFIWHIKERYKLPVLIAGDFNVDIRSIERENIVQPPFKLCMYQPSERRSGKGKFVDFFIITEEMGARDFNWFDIDRHVNTTEFTPTEVLDHDPVSATVCFAP